MAKPEPKPSIASTALDLSGVLRISQPVKAAKGTEMAKPFFFRIDLIELMDFATDPEFIGMTLLEFIKILDSGELPSKLRGKLKGPFLSKKFNRPSPAIWKPVKARILERDNYTCAYCGVRGVRLEVDHIVAVSRGGSHGDDNLTAACIPCNRSKSNKTVEEWRSNNG